MNQKQELLHTIHEVWFNVYDYPWDVTLRASVLDNPSDGAQ